jgi:hypothetical protein
VSKRDLRESVLTNTNTNNLYVVTNTCRRDDRAPRVSMIRV